jgi:hypothetical protein
MGKLLQIASNLALYGFLVWLLYDSTVREPDPWFAVVVGFVLVLSLIITFVPALHARTISPGEYPYDD